MKKLLLVMSMCVFGAGMLMAETYTFDNAAGGKLWNTAGNWKTNGIVATTLPTAADDVVANTSGGDALQIDTDSAVANNMAAGSTASSVSEISIGSGGVLNVSGNQTFAGGAGSSVTFVNAGTNIVNGIFQTMSAGQSTIVNSGTLTNASSQITLADTDFTNTASGVVYAKSKFNVDGGSVVNYGNITFDHDHDTSSIKNTTIENMASGTVYNHWRTTWDSVTFTNRGFFDTGKGQTLRGTDWYIAAGATNDFGGVFLYTSPSTIINEGRMRASLTSGMRMQYGTLLNRGSGSVTLAILQMAANADSMCVISNAATLTISRGGGYGWMATAQGTSVVHNAASGTLTTLLYMRLSTAASGFTSITNWGTISVGSDLYLADEGETEFTMLGGTLSAGTLTNGVNGTGVLYVHGGTSTFDNVTIFDASSPTYGNCTIDVRDPGVLVVENMDLTSEFNTAKSAGYLTGGAGLDVTYDGSDTIVTSPNLGTVISIH